MKRNSATAKLFFTLLFCTAYIFSFSHYGANAVDMVFSGPERFGAHTEIAGVQLSGVTSQEAIKKLSLAQTQWEENTKISLHYREKAAEADLKMFDFELEESVNLAQSGKRSNLIVQIDEGSLAELLLTLGVNEMDTGTLDISRLEADLLLLAAMLEGGGHSFKLNSYLPETGTSEVISEAMISGESQLEQMRLWTEQFSTIEIAANSSVSILKTVNGSNSSEWNAEALSLVATAIYKTVLPTNFLISERHIGRELPAHAEAGYEAKIDLERNMDFVFNNPNDLVYQLQFKMIGTSLYVSLKGSQFSDDYTVKIEDKQTFKPKTIVQYSAQLSFGETETLIEGKDGTVVKVYRTVSGPNGKIVKEELVAEDFYAPVHKVMLRSLIVAESEESLAGDTESLPESNLGEAPGVPANSGQGAAESSAAGDGSGQAVKPAAPQNSGTESDLSGQPTQPTK
ncbi:hypothetical protein CVD25_17430 [Bacillus canaveralius]|uniref:G5 domain-containing protein n=1 Tax=Bacillus canaveralius TaxID=1403243 RepID=A0A2N5GQ28_9BACI|nr:G5 domain-containing protein [Bacillus canaveralius]PLR84986.1 hypothetical protein CU635_05020 [Bacillus canaveralius]PLR93247.1 hypothetical protein CVD25_17430 [Bacillus canaveralius]RSK52447.1 hypothetical protein EJA13_10920 [Bacillus canaveralius]